MKLDLKLGDRKIFRIWDFPHVLGLDVCFFDIQWYLELRRLRKSVLKKAVVLKCLGKVKKVVFCEFDGLSCPSSASGCSVEVFGALSNDAVFCCSRFPFTFKDLLVGGGA